MRDALGDRMKNNYESVTDFKLIRRMPVIIRLDIRAGHNVTKKMKFPWDDIFHNCMDFTMTTLCQDVQNAQFAYTQSDEISILLCDFYKLDTEQFFGGRVQKIASTTASMASLAFNRALMYNLMHADFETDSVQQDMAIYANQINKVVFDSRVFNVPANEVCNYFIWRQKDAERNSLQMLSYSVYSHKELYKKNRDDMHEMLHQKNINWNNYPTKFKRGTCAIKLFSKWHIDDDIPIFTQDREYINKYLHVDEEK